MTKHTPGPWNFDGAINGLVDGGPDGKIIAIVYPCYHHNASEMKANAYLVAAAPELLEALEFATRMYQENFENMPFCWQTVQNFIDDAINKAKGLS